MVLDHTKVVYTAEDEQGFTFRQMMRMQPWSLGHGEKRGTGGF